MFIIKPGGLYLDITAEASRAAPDHPLAAFQVGGEFAMITAGAKAGAFDLKTMAFESTQAFLRAGPRLVPRPALTWLTLPCRLFRDYILLHTGLLGLVGGVNCKTEIQKKSKLYIIFVSSCVPNTIAPALSRSEQMLVSTRSLNSLDSALLPSALT